MNSISWLNRSFLRFRGINYMNHLLKKVYKVSNKNQNTPRISLEHFICESVGLEVGEHLYVTIEKDKIIIQNQPTKQIDHEISVSYRTHRSTGIKRPLIDSCGMRYQSIISVKQKIEVNVYRENNLKRIVITPLKYNLHEEVSTHCSKDERNRLISLCAGSGIATAALVDTGYFTPVMEIEMEDDSSEVLKRNFPNSLLFTGDLRDVHEVKESDVLFASLPCNNFSTLGNLQEGTFMNLVIAASKVIRSSNARVIFMENVPGFYNSEAFWELKELLNDKYPYWSTKTIESYEFGSISTRKRTYAVAFQCVEDYQSFTFPIPPKCVKRFKLKRYLDNDKVLHKWHSISDWLDRYHKKSSKIADKNIDKTFVSEEATQIRCIVKKYANHSITNSYVVNKENSKWRLLSIDEIRRILAVPDWFEFGSFISKTRKYELLGQSVDCNIIRAIGNKIASVLMKAKRKVKNTIYDFKKSFKLELTIPIEENENTGQLSIIF